MKKKTTLSLLLLLPIIFSTLSNATIIIHPLELTIAMDNDFIHGNTSKKIMVKNNNDYTYNVTWYLEHPKPISYLRPDRTFMPDLSWIDVEPKWLIIPPARNRAFYIHLDIPENEELLDQHWETWVTFQLNENETGGGIFEYEYAIRVYIDTPHNAAVNNYLDNNSNNDYYIIYYILILATIIILLILGILLYHKKINKK